MRDAERVRKNVSETYARAVTSPSGGHCCSDADPAALAARIGYGEEDLASLPSDAVEHAFGCGNPTAFSDVREGDVVLDLGSGAGIDLLVAARKVGPTGRVIGVDMTDEMIEKARENVAAAGLSDVVEVRKGTIEDLPVETSSVDWVISNCVINLSPEKDKVFSEIARVLKPGGRMLVSDIVAEGLPERVRADRALHDSCIGGAISEEAYLAGLRDAGLVDVDVRARLQYGIEEIQSLIESVASGVKGSLPSAADSPFLKVWSINVYARRPG
jgi:SAM-dependent methyltransferase